MYIATVNPMMAIRKLPIRKSLLLRHKRTGNDYATKELETTYCGCTISLYLHKYLVFKATCVPWYSVSSALRRFHGMVLSLDMFKTGKKYHRPKSSLSVKKKKQNKKERNTHSLPHSLTHSITQSLRSYLYRHDKRGRGEKRWEPAVGRNFVRRSILADTSLILKLNPHSGPINE